MTAQTGRTIPLGVRTISLFASTIVVVGICASAALAQEDGPPLWAFGYNEPAPPGATVQRVVPVVRDNAKRLTLPGSKLSFTDADIQSYFAPADWFPEDHPPLPDVVAHGRISANPQVRACAFCHMPNGMGRPENATLAGLPADYIIQQLADYKNKLIAPADPRKTNLMVDFATSMTQEEVKTVADYFSLLPFNSSADKPWIKVVETATIPKMKAEGGVFIPVTGPDAGTESLGQRVLEVPVNVEETELLRNPRSGFIAYAPPGSIKKGEELATTGGGGRFTPCTACHGLGLQGLGPVPPLAGRSPSHFGREVYDIQNGTRTGAWSPLMAAVVAELTPDDIVNLAAYTASLTP